MQTQPSSAAQASRRTLGEIGVGLALMVAGAVGLWVMTAAWPSTPDGEFHLQRTRALAEAFGQGVFYPRWFPDFAFGYGHPILHYYAPGSYALPALLHAWGMDLLAATRLVLALGFGASGVAAYGALRVVAQRPAALAGALLYLAFPYRHYDLFVRGALPEFAAFLWLPLILAGALWALRVPAHLRAAILLAALSWAGLALTHNLTTLMAALILVVALPVVAWRTRSWRPPLALSTGPILGASLSAFYTIPALLEASWVGIGSAPAGNGYLSHLAGWTELWQWSWVYHYPSAAQPTVPLPGYVAVLMVVGLALAVLTRPQRFSLLVALLAVVLPLWLSSAASAWVWDATAPVLGKLQFPWRWQTILAISVASLAALSLNGLRPRMAWLAALVLGMAAWGYALPPSADPSAPPAITRASMWAFDAAHGQVGATWTGEFLPRWVTAPRWTIGREPQAPHAGTATALDHAQPERIGYLDAVYRVTAQEATTLTLDRFYFPAWRVTVDGAAVATAPQGELGLLSVAIPAGTSRVEVAWTATPALWAGRVLSAVGWLLVSVLLWRGHRAGLAAWLAVGALALVGMSGMTARVHDLRPVTAAYGAATLSGATVRPTGAGLEVTLFWTIHAPPPAWTVFVHARDEDGQMVGQWDEPLGGPYRPPARLLPGMLMQQTITVPLTVAKGAVDVAVGLYPAGAAHAPLIPAGGDAAVVPLGTVEAAP